MTPTLAQATHARHIYCPKTTSGLTILLFALAFLFAIPLQAQIEHGEGNFCVGSRNSFSYSGCNSLSPGDWIINSGDIIEFDAQDNNRTVFITWNNPVQNISIGVRPSCGGDTQYYPTFRIESIPTISVSSPQNWVCSGEQITLTATGATSYNWSWTDAAGFHQLLRVSGTLPVSPNENTTYKVVGYSENGDCQSSEASITIRVFTRTIEQVGTLSGGSATPQTSGNNSGTLTLSGYDGYSIQHWEYSNNNGFGWQEFRNNGQATYTYQNLTSSTIFRVKFYSNNPCASIYSTSAQIPIEKRRNWIQTLVYGETYQTVTANVAPSDPNTYYSTDAIVLPQPPATALQITPSSQYTKYVSAHSITIKNGVSIGAGATAEFSIMDNSTVVVPGETVVISENRSYMDGYGRITQSQSRDVTRNELLVAQSLYDGNGVRTVETMPAPVGQGSFYYAENFITSGGAPYNFSHFETNPNQPLAVDDTQPNSLGWYYSNNNTREPFAATTAFPFSQHYVDPAGSVNRSAGPGDQHRMGAGHESRSATVPILDELNHYLLLRNAHFIPTNATSLELQGVKSVTVDVNGRESIVLTDKEGKVLASCRSGAEFPGIAVNTSVSAYVDQNGVHNSLDIHLPHLGEGITTSVNAGVGVQVRNLLNGSLVPPQESGIYNLVGGFYRIVSSNYNMVVSYTLKYGEFSYNYYNDADRLIATVAPKGVDLNSSAMPKFVTRYDYSANGDMIQSSSPDEGQTEFIHRRDGVLRFSQNAQQKIDRKFSYTNYDRRGRPLQSGEYSLPAESNVNSSFEMQLQSLFGSEYTRILEDVTRTGGLPDATRCSQKVDSYYDMPAPDVPGNRVQRFTLGTVAKTQNEHSTTFYSYDETGRIEWSIQSIVGLGDKTIEYIYDRNGNVREVAYQKGTPSERFTHYYSYDQDQRLTEVHTSRDGFTKKRQAKYYYYLHGPLKRVELADQLQGTDYVYTIQGWLKSINHPKAGSDPGKDGDGNGFAKDVFSMSLEYFSGDYTKAGTIIASIDAAGYQSFYSRRVKAVVWQTKKPQSVIASEGINVENPQMYVYQYDAKYQLKEAVWGNVDMNVSSGLNAFTPTGLHKEFGLSYDEHGNISSLQRNNKDGILKDNFVNAYTYKTGTNQLEKITGFAKYTYDALGQMTAQEKDGISSDVQNQYIEYNAKGLVMAVYSDAAKTIKKVSFYYSERGQRLKKINHSTNITTYYIRDARGNELTTYDNDGTALLQKQFFVYGADRLGIYKVRDNSYQYELADHQGNIRAVIKDIKLADNTIDVLRYADFLVMGGTARSGGTSYNYGYQGKFAEQDNETQWNSFELRMYDSRIGRWNRPDPYGQFDSPYLAMGNDWSNQVDPDGGWSGGPGPGFWGRIREFFGGRRMGSAVARNVQVVKGAGGSNIVGNRLYLNIMNLATLEVGKATRCYPTVWKRVKQAYEDVNKGKAPEVFNNDGFYNKKDGDRWYPTPDSDFAKLFGTNIDRKDFMNLPYEHRGKGGAGALVHAGLADPVDDIWDGQLQPGAVLQLWTHKEHYESIRDKGEYHPTAGSNFGHSVIFLYYHRGPNGQITGLSYADQHGVYEMKKGDPNATYQFGVGANLK